MALLDTLKDPRFLGYALQQIGATGRPQMQTMLQDRYMQEQRGRQFQGLLGGMDLTEQQRGLLATLPPDQAMGLLAQREFAQAPQQVPGRDVPYSPEVLEQQMQLRGHMGGESGPDIGTYNPRDYTSESWAKFVESKDPRVLERYQRFRQIGGQLWDMEAGVPVADVTPALGAGAAATAAGTKAGEAKADLPTASATAKTTIESIKQIREHPGRVHGWGARVPDWAVDPNSPEADWREMVEQLSGQTFLQAYQQLKGGGVISDRDAIEAKAAIARLKRAKSRAAFDKALDDLERIAMRGLDTARRKARTSVNGNVSRETIPNQGGPQPGATEDGYRFRGGDPANPANWERVQ